MAGGAIEDILFTMIPDTAGEKIVHINGLLGSLVVAGEIIPLERTKLPPEKPVSSMEPEPTPTTAPTTATEPEPASSNAGKIAGIIIGCVLVVALAGYFTWRWRRGTVKPG